MKHWIVALAMAGLVAGCGGQSAPPPGGPETEPAADPAADAGKSGEVVLSVPPVAADDVKVAFVTNNASDFWKIAEAGTDKAKAELGCEVLFKIPPTGTPQEQKQILEDLITIGVTGIAISPIDPANQTRMLNDAAKDVHLVTQDSDAPESDRVCYIGTDNYAAGVAAGELIKDALPEGGKIMLFVGTLDAQNARDRMKGIEDTLKDTNIEIVDTRTDETDRSKAKANAQDALVANPDLACLVGLWSYNGPAILTGVEASDMLGKVKIVCFDEEEATLQGVQDGHIVGTVVQQPFEFGYQSVKLLAALSQGDASMVPKNRQIFIPVVKVTQENVAEFWARLKELKGQS